MARLMIGFEDDRDREFAQYLQNQPGSASISEFWNDFNKGNNGGMTKAVKRVQAEYGGDRILACTAFVAVCAESGAYRI